jgi:hypothetical protein
MTHNPSWIYADYKVIEASLGINVSDINSSTTIFLNIKLFLFLLLASFHTLLKMFKLICLKVDKDQFFELVLFDKGDHSEKLFKKNNFSSPKFISIFDQNNLFKYSTFSISTFLKILLKNYKIALGVIKMPSGNLKKTIINHLYSSLPNSIFYEYFFTDLINHNKKFIIVSSSCLIFPLTIAGNLQIDIKVKMHGLMGKVLPEGFPRLSKLQLIHKDEVNYFKKKFPSCKLSLIEHHSIKSKQKVVIIFLRQKLELMSESNNDNLQSSKLADAINFFKERKFKVFLKLHPHSLFPEKELSAQFKSVEFINNERLAPEVITDLCPSFVLGWLSSSLIEALNMGIIPITLETKPYESIVSRKMIVNFEERILNYETDINEIIKATNLPMNYSRILGSLNN